MKSCLDPIISDTSRVLILGTLPGDESLRLQQYYANPRNPFWAILAAVFEVSPSPKYSERVRFLHRRGLALWDVLKGADREGSLDSRIQKGRVNDFPALFAQYPALTAVVFNGVGAQKRFQRYVRGSAMLGTHRFMTLPNTSPTPGRYVLPLPKKIEEWKALRQRALT
ncbi:MAG: DNA-deoxyinosine glycosylase [Proteobacteria bacterium]|nr:DNA-deoxyinosine glycosylase [Pseudomonadota bacterium]